MVDAVIVMVENAHRRLHEWEQQGRKGTREDIIISAAQEVGKPLFFSLLIITVSFLPIFTLEAQEGRLFKPLAYTKTFSMFFAARHLVPILLVPIAVVLSFIAMYYLGITSNVMSLSGIAIAIGAMVDAVIVMVENAHRRLHEWEQQGRKGTREDIIISAAQEVGKPLFFSLLIITVSFLPIFTLEAQEGRLFKPLAYTKTFSMFFAALVSITVAPLLMNWFIRGRILAESRNPVNRLLIWLYTPLVKGALHLRWLVVGLAVVGMLWVVPFYQELGSEFMPPLNEGMNSDRDRDWGHGGCRNRHGRKCAPTLT